MIGVGFLAVFLSLWLAYAGRPHFYSVFSIGMLLITYGILRSLDVRPFRGWRWWQHGLFWSMLISISIIIDSIGIRLGYWRYPSYAGLLDEVLKYSLEWAVPFVYCFFFVWIGFLLYRKRHGNLTAGALSVVTFGTAIGIITSASNLTVDSWLITDMPLLDAKIGGMFLLFVTVGYWLMTGITWTLYRIVIRRTA